MSNDKTKQKGNYYKQYALRCLLKGKTNSRAFDNCFEDGHGDEVVIYLMKKATEALPPLPDGFSCHGLSDEKAARLAKKHAIQKELKSAIKKAGYWGSWVFTYSLHLTLTDMLARENATKFNFIIQ